MWKNSKALLASFFALIILAPYFSGCAASQSSNVYDTNVNPFTLDRVATVRVVMKDSDWADMRANAFAKNYYQADFWFDGELVPDVAVRTKGNASLGQTVGWNSPRLPLAIDFNLLNKYRTFHGIKKVHFNNGWSDPTLLRDVISYEIFRNMGVPAPRASLVDLYVNDLHLGVYTMAEAVDKPLLERYFANTYGNLYKPEVAAARLDWTEKNAYKNLTIYGMPQPQTQQNPIMNINLGGGNFFALLKALGAVNSIPAFQKIAAPAAQGNAARGLPAMVMPRNLVEAAGLKTNQEKPNYSGLFHFLDILNNEPGATFPQEIEKVLDVDETLKFFAVSACIVHLDNYIGIGHNTYFYEVNGKFTCIPWDLNMTFGTYNAGLRKDGIINYYIDEPTTGPMNRFPLVNRLLSYKPYLDRYNQFMQELLDGPFSLDVVLPRIDHLVELIRPYVKADTEMFYSYEDWERCINEDLRPPDLFEGWQAGGPSPMMPWSISQHESAALRKNFNVGSLWELMSSFKESDIKLLRASISQKNADLFLQNMYGPLMAPQPPRQPGFGPNCLGLKTFIIARYASVQQQLNGEKPCISGNNTGNGASMWIADMYLQK
jgi:hypothetical protein